MKNMESMDETCAFMATTFIVKSGRQLLVRFLCVRESHGMLDAVRMVSSASQLAAAIAWDGTEDVNEPLGSGRPFVAINFIHRLSLFQVNTCTCET